MRTLTNIIDAAAVHATAECEATMELQDLSYAVGDPALAEIEHVARRSPVSNAVRVVGVLAFGQSILFLVLWLLICASAGAATVAKKASFDPVLQQSSYAPTKTRDPFAKSGVMVGTVKSPSTVVPVLQLDGILYETARPSAIVNGQLLLLNKTVNLDVNGESVPVKAVAITRHRVTVEVVGQKVELQMNSEKP